MFLRGRILIHLILTSVLLLPLLAQAIDTPDVLPIGIRNAALRMGNISGLSEYYTDSGELKYLSDINSVELNAANLSEISAEFNHLRNVLNQFSNQNLGDKLTLGKLAVDADPNVRYFAPIFLYGITNKLTLGLAVPVIYYTNDISIVNEGSNLKHYRQEFAGLSPEINDAFNQLDTSMQAEFHKAVANKGFKPVDSRQETFIGDVQLVSAYQFYKFKGVSQTIQLLAGLPTGPQADPDDLTDIENFGRWTLKPNWIVGKKLNSRYTILGSASYLYVMPMDQEKRVPLNAEDSLPDDSQKMTLTEDIGDSASIGTGVAYTYSSNLSTLFGYNYEEKFKDNYSGAPSGRDGFLERGTEKQAHIARIEFIYSVVKDFFRKQSPFPGTANLEVSRIVSGENIENQTRLELTLNLYF